MEGGNQAGGTNGQQAGWVFEPGGSDSAPQQTPAPTEPSPTPPRSDKAESVEWTGSEFVAHQKSLGWFMMLFLAAAIVAALVYFITKEIFSTAIVVFAAIVFAAAGVHKPRVLAFRLDQSGLTIGQKFYPYGQFKSFAVIEDGAFSSVVFMPLKRFLPPIDIYIPPDNAEKIMEVLSANLPVETRELGLIDTLARRIRF